MSARILTLDEAQQLTGQEIGVSDWFLVTQDAINHFADLTHDHQWIHIDSERAQRESPFHATIAHGFFTLSLLSHLAKQVFEVQGDFKMTINYGLNRVRFVSPVPAGSRVRARVAVKEASAGQAIWLVTIELEGGSKPALAAEWITRYY